MSRNIDSINASSFLIVFGFLVSLLGQRLVVSSQSCEFPSEVQTDVVGQSWKRDWRSEVRDQFTRFTQQVTVHGGVLRVTPTEPRDGPAPLTRHCTRVVLGDRFLVAEEDANRRRRGYTCLRFVVRSAEIVQIWSTNLSTIMDPELCSDASLRPDKWLTVDHARLGVTRVKCPLEGGFTMRVFDKMRQRGICDAYDGETRLESECSSGDGLTFLFRTQTCVPEDMLMYATQPTHCLATWNDGHYTFTVLRHYLFNYTWLLRFPATQSNAFTAYLFKDLIADTADILTSTANYLRLDTTRDAERSPGDLCFDDYERCSSLRTPCPTASPASRTTLVCPLKCGLCQATSPQVCRLKPEWMGKWDAEGRANNRSNSVTINGTTMTLHSHHHSENLRCVKWQTDDNNNKDNNDDDDGVMFVTEFSNGCRPRYSCALIQNLSSSTLNVTISKSSTWPFIQNPGDPLDCSAPGFKPRIPMEANRTRILLLHARTSQHPVSCDLPFRASNARIRFSNATTCNGRLAETKGRRSVELSLRGCSSPVTTTHVFSCLESSRLPPPHNDLVVTMRTNLSSDAVEIYCLVFPTTDATAFHLLSGSDACQQVFRRETSLDRLHLLRGTLSDTTHRATTSRGPTTEETPQTDSRSKAVDASTVGMDDPTSSPSESVSRTSRGVSTSTPATSVVEGTPSEGLSRPVDDRRDTSTPAYDPTVLPTTEHPIVIAFAAVLFGIIQGVVYICTCF